MRAKWTLLAATLLFAAPLSGQQRPPPGPALGRGQMEERVRERFDEIVRTQLGLDAAASRRLVETVRSFHEEREALMRRDMQLRRRLRIEGGDRLLSGDREQLLADPEARAVLDEMTQLRREEVELHQREQERLLEVLAPGQLVRFYMLREAMGDRLRRVRGGFGGPGGPGMPGGPLRPGGGGPGRRPPGGG